MIRIAVVEDDPAYQRQLVQYIRDYEASEQLEIQIDVFNDGVEILEEDTARFDLILMDIEMAHMDGMETARRIRRQNREVLILFITNLSQYAIQGYQVEALSYVLKPINYFAFSQELSRAVRKIREQEVAYCSILLKTGMLRLKYSELTYVESQGNNVIYHTREKDYVNRESLRKVEERLDARQFCRCNNCYLVNLAFVERVESSTITVAGQVLAMSRSRKKPFMEAMAAYMGRA